MVYDASVFSRPTSNARSSARWAGVAAFAASSALSLWTSIANADPVWVDRRLTLTQGEGGVDLGLGLADDLRDHVVGPGMFAAVHYGLNDRAEISVREGLNFGLYGRYARAEQYGRLYTLSGSTTPGPGAFANPDLVFLDRFLDFGFLELAAEFEMGVPVEDKTHLAGTVGIGATFHFFSLVRLDTGAFVTATLRSPSSETYVVPIQLWIEPIPKFPVWLGPLMELKVDETPTNHNPPVDIPFGIGVGYAVNSDIDIRAQWFDPQINVSPGTRVYGWGIGTQIRLR